MNQSTHPQNITADNREERRTEATRRLNATLAKLVAVERHDVVRQQLLEIIAQATGYRYAMLSEMEPDEQHLRVVAAYAPYGIIQGLEKLVGYRLIGHRVVNTANVALKTPPTEVFDHVYEWRPEFNRPLSTAIELLMGIRHIVSIRLHTGDYYLGAANFVATHPRVDQVLLEYLCHNHLVFALRLIQEQSARERLQAQRTHELQSEIQERRQIQEALRESEESLRKLYTITADQQMNFAAKVQALLEVGCRRFGATVGILAAIDGEAYKIEEVYAPNVAMAKGDIFALGQTYCRETLKADQPVSFEHAGATEWANHPCYKLFHLESYVGTAVRLLSKHESHTFGTLSFSAPTPRPMPFKASDLEFLSLMAQWIGGEIERQQRAEQLQAYAAQIEQANHALAIARDRALEVSRLKSEFLATMSHEIRTPMNGIMGMTELLLTTELNPRQQGYAKIVLKETDHLLHIINDILDFSKIEAGRLTLEQEGFAPIIVVESVADLLSAQAAAKQIALMTFIAPDVPTILQGDGNRLRQILLNLVGNAIKFTTEGEVTVQVTLTSIVDQQVVLHFAVMDTGIGIADEQQHHLFQPFTQIDGGVTRRHGGTGLGLAIAERLVGMMGGKIGVKSYPGYGSTFWFTANFRLSTIGRHDHRNPKMVLDSVRILIADSNQVHSEILESYLTSWGAEVAVVVDSKKVFSELARAAQTAQPYQIAIIDQPLPVTDGVAIGQEIAQTRLLQSTHFVMLTVYNGQEQQRNGQETGDLAYLTKPVRQIDLRNMLLTVLGRSLPMPPVKTERQLASLGTNYSIDYHQLAPIHSQEGTRPETMSPVILVVEDHSLNQTVTLGQLAALGYQVTIVDNGYAALNHLQQPDHGYRLVFMDCQMPELDGFETTRRIRAWEQEHGGHIPIIAMTAQAMTQDEARCFAAGMDGYLSKPVRIEQLRATLQQWL